MPPAVDWSQLLAPRAAQSTPGREDARSPTDSGEQHQRLMAPTVQSWQVAPASAREQLRTKLHANDAGPLELHPRKENPTAPQQPPGPPPDRRLARRKKVREPQHIAQNSTKHEPLDEPAAREQPHAAELRHAVTSEGTSRRAPAEATHQLHGTRGPVADGAMQERDVTRKRLWSRLPGDSAEPPKSPAGAIGSGVRRKAVRQSRSPPDVETYTDSSAESVSVARRGQSPKAVANKTARGQGRLESATRDETEVARGALAKELSRREPRAPQQPGKSVLPHHTGAPDVSVRRARSASPQRRRRPKVYCSNNRLDPALRINGGTLEVGTRGRCVGAGYGAALFQRIEDEAAFIKKVSAHYEPLVQQQLWYKDSDPPPGYQAATLSQARQRGWGAGSAALARKLQATQVQKAARLLAPRPAQTSGE